MFVFRRHLLTLVLLLLQRWNCETAVSEVNQLVNGDFSEPQVVSLVRYYQDSTEVPGWSCTNTCQIVSCKLAQKMEAARNRIFASCSGQVIDLDSNGYHESLQQLVNLKAMPYQLNFKYYYPLSASNRKRLKVYFNKKLIFTHNPQVVSSLQEFSQSQQVYAREGMNNLTFAMSGLTDFYGFKIGKVSLKKVYNLGFQTSFNSSMVNSLVLGIAAVPGSRIIFGSFINLFISLDRLELYWFHDRSYSYNIQLLLDNIQIIKATEGTLLNDLFQRFFPSKISEISQKIESLNYKQPYINTNILNKSERGYELLSNNEDFLFYSLPIILFTVILGQFLFSLLQRWRISKLIRKFSFRGIVLLMIAEGNIEKMTFYYFGEIRSLFCFTNDHKIKSVFIIFLFSIFLFCTTSLFLWLKFSYGKMVKYFSEQYEVKLIGIFALSVDRGLICMAFGAAHQLLLSYPNQQLLLLSSLQLISISCRFLWLTRKVFHEQKLLVWIAITENLVRMVFHLNCFLYKSSNQIPLNKFLNNQVHLCLVTVFLVIWLIELALAVIYCLLEFRQTISRLFFEKSEINRTVNRESTNCRTQKETTCFIYKKREQLIFQ